MPRPAFTVLTGSVAALVVLGFVSRAIRPYIPKPAENSLSREDSQFLSRASNQQIDWIKPSPEAFAQARRSDRPILLFIGNTHNPYARELDAGAFQLPRVQSYLGRNFECIRVDALANPEYRSAILPVSRAVLGLVPGCQLWVLDPKGKIIHVLPKAVILFPRDENVMIEALIEARDRFAAPRSSGPSSYEVAQEKDMVAMLQPTQTLVPGFQPYIDELVAKIDSKSGGFGNDVPRLLAPEAWRLLLAMGKESELEQSLDPILRSPTVDLLDGGFFQGSRDADWYQVEYDKSAVANAAMLRLLSSMAAISKRPLDRYLAIRTWDCLADEFVNSTGVAASRPGDVDEGGRSNRSSFSVRRFREAFEDDVDRTWAQMKLGMMVETNPRMTPRIADLRILDTDRLAQILKILRASAGPRPDRTAAGYAEATGFVIARMIESARILGDPVRVARAVDNFSLVESFRVDDTVMHSFQPGLRDGNALDHLAYADAALEHYLATGRYSSLQNGLSVLRRTLRKFKTDMKGVLRISGAPVQPTPSYLGVPELCDPQSESCLAQAIRIGNDYARVLSASNTDCADLRTFVNTAVANYASTAGALGYWGAGFYISAAEVFDDQFFVTVGPSAQQWSDSLTKFFPTRLVTTAFGDVRPDLQKRGPGVYWVRGEQVRGPMSLEQAKKSSSPTLQPGG